ncbi:MAG: hypothetical protein ACOCV8_05105, partial [Spirochaetota bacterium]
MSDKKRILKNKSRNQLSNIKKYLNKFVSDNISIIIFIFVVIYALLFFFTINNLDKPESRLASYVLFIVPSVGILLWLFKILIDKFKKKPGAGLTLRLTSYFLIITSIPFFMLIINSNNMVEEIYQDYISLDSVEDSLNDITDSLYQKTAEEIKSDIEISKDMLSTSYTVDYKEDIPDSPYSENIIDMGHTDYIILFSLNIEEEKAEIIKLFNKNKLNKEKSSDNNIEINEENINNLLKENYFYSGEIIEKIKNEDSQSINSYKLSDNNYINYYIEYLDNPKALLSKNASLIKNNEFNSLQKEYNYSNDFFIMGIYKISEFELEIYKNVSDLSGLIAKRSLNKEEAQEQLILYIIFIS